MKLYVGNLSRDLQVNVLKELFDNMNIKVDDISLRNGYAFVDCPLQEHADEAVDKLNRFNFMGNDLVVEPSLPRAKFFKIQIKNAPEKINIEDLQDLFATFGKVLKLEKTNNSPNSYIVTYGSISEARDAIENLNKKEFDGEIVDVDMLKRGPPRRVGPGFGPGGPGGRMRRGGSRTRRPFQGGYAGAGHPGAYINGGGPMAAQRNNISVKVSEFPLKISVPSEMVGAIIGRGGETIKSITQASHAHIDVMKREMGNGAGGAGDARGRNFMLKPRDMSLIHEWQTIMIVGTLEACSLACRRILEIMNEEGKTSNKGEIPLKILAHNNMIGRIIGKNGNNVKQLMAESDARITVSSSGGSDTNMERTITIKGSLDSIMKAQQLITAKLKQSYESDLIAMQNLVFPGMPHYGNSRDGVGLVNMANYFPGLFFGNTRAETETVFLNIPYASVGAIIGTKGANIRNIKAMSGAQIVISPPEKGEENSKARKVTIIGTPEAQWRAQFHIFEKIQNEGFAGMDEVSLTCQIYVPTTLVGRIIGRKGQNVQELQKLTGAMINVTDEPPAAPEENDENGRQRREHVPQSCISIQGPFYPNQSAQRRIRSIIAQTRSTSAPPPMRRRRFGDRAGNGPNPQQANQHQNGTPDEGPLDEMNMVNGERMD